MNFAETCQENDGRLQNVFTDLIEIADATTKIALTKFAEFVEREGSVGVNMRPMVLLGFLRNDRLLNIHEWADGISKKGGLPTEEILREKLGTYFERRIAFDQYFEEGFRFRYGALTAGGLAAVKYGEFCLAFRHSDVLAACTVGYLKSDSLNHYVNDECRVDEGKLRHDCASEPQKQLLATVKHAISVPRKPVGDWAAMLCNSDEYVEAIIVEGDLRPAHLRSVRIGKLDYDLYWEYAYQEFGEKLSELDRYRVDAFAAIDEELRSKGIPWETIDNA